MKIFQQYFWYLISDDIPESIASKDEEFKGAVNHLLLVVTEKNRSEMVMTIADDTTSTSRHLQTRNTSSNHDMFVQIFIKFIRKQN